MAKSESFEAVVRFVSEACRPYTARSTTIDSIHFGCVPESRRKSSSFKEGRWMTWAFLAQNFQFTALLLVVFWACVEDTDSRTFPDSLLEKHSSTSTWWYFRRAFIPTHAWTRAPAARIPKDVGPMKRC